MTALLVILGGSAGSVARWSTDRAVSARHTTGLPWGTFIINLVGSFVLGLVLGARLGPSWAVLLGTGFCGAFTTFSTFAFEAVRLSETGRRLAAVLYVGGSLAFGLALVTLGWWLGEALHG